MTKRKYNAILWCDKTPNGYWSIGMESPEGTIQRKTYVGYSRADAIRKAKRENIDEKHFSIRVSLYDRNASQLGTHFPMEVITNRQ